MRRLSVLVLSLATVLALAGVTQAKKPEGTPGGPPNGDDDGPLKYSQFSAPLADASGEIPSSLAEIDNHGNWSLTTTELFPGEPYDICLVSFFGPGSGPGKLWLEKFNADINGKHSTGLKTAPSEVNGNWQAPSFQVRDDDNSDCMGPIIQESGIEITGYGVSKFSAPFVALDPSDVIIGEVESTAQISSSGYWILAASGLKQRQRYDICLFFFDPSDPTPFLFLSDRTSGRSGKLYAKGNAYDRYGSVTLQAPSFQIMEEPEDFANNCEGPLAQETGLFINAPAP